MKRAFFRRHKQILVLTRMLALLIILITTQNICAQETGKRMLSDEGFYTSLGLIQKFRFVEAEKMIETFKGNPIEKQLASMNLLWWQGLLSGPNNIFLNELKVMTNQCASTSDNFSDTGTSDNVLQLSCGIFQIRLAGIEGNRVSGLKTIHSISPFLKEVLANATLNEEYALLAGVYNYAAGSLKSQYYILRPFFMLMPSANPEQGKEALIKLTKSGNQAMATEAAYFLYKIEKEINEDLTAASSYLQHLIKNNPGNIIYQIEWINLLDSQGLGSQKARNELRQMIAVSNLMPEQKTYLIGQLDRETE
ncbi:MAG: hypothetical protein IH597_15380 [Bacteroidales bacterium]|nr:hypothetical protein [Bacteroidales bacterium]